MPLSVQGFALEVMGRYFVYEWVRVEHDRATPIAVVHTADCPSCNGGQGRATNAGQRRGLGRWHGPYAELAEARQAAAALAGEARTCRRCTPF